MKLIKWFALMIYPNELAKFSFDIYKNTQTKLWKNNFYQILLSLEIEEKNGFMILLDRL